ncbi:MAG: hypothetical protein WC675_00780 [Patescibacteria group bacterium]|jgi:hypothetical protein
MKRCTVLLIAFTIMLVLATPASAKTAPNAAIEALVVQPAAITPLLTVTPETYAATAGDYLLTISARPDVDIGTSTALSKSTANITANRVDVELMRTGDVSYIAGTRTMAAVVVPATHPDAYHFAVVEAAYADIGSSFVGSSLVASPAPGSSLIIGYAPAPVLTVA